MICSNREPCDDCTVCRLRTLLTFLNVVFILQMLLLIFNMSNFYSGNKVLQNDIVSFISQVTQILSMLFIYFVAQFRIFALVQRSAYWVAVILYIVIDCAITLCYCLKFFLFVVLLSMGLFKTPKENDLISTCRQSLTEPLNVDIRSERHYHRASVIILPGDILDLTDSDLSDCTEETSSDLENDTKRSEFQKRTIKSDEIISPNCKEIKRTEVNNRRKLSATKKLLKNGSNNLSITETDKNKEEEINTKADELVSSGVVRRQSSSDEELPYKKQKVMRQQKRK